MRLSTKLSLLALSSLTFGLTTYSLAATPIGKLTNDSASTLTYWTEGRLKNAKPLPLHRANPSHLQTITIENDDSAFSQEGAPPTFPIKPMKDLLFHGTPIEHSTEIEPNDVGTRNIHFSSSRLDPQSADLSYPYSAVGKLFFTIPSEGDFVCSASVIAQRIVVTAGHCVHSGSGGPAGYFTNFLFVPAYRDNNAPFQRWTGSFAITTPAWMSGGGQVPNAGDFALLEMNDNTVSGQVKTIASVTGKLGFAINKLGKNHLHMLGYPCNLDNCQKMHQVTSQNGVAVAPNNVTYGSDMEGGSSGGPWVQNFGTAAAGQSGGQNPGRNQVVAVTSWGYNNPAAKVQGAANFNNTFTTIYNTACAHKAGNC